MARSMPREANIVPGRWAQRTCHHIDAGGGRRLTLCGDGHVDRELAEEGRNGGVIVHGMQFDNRPTDKAAANAFGDIERGFPPTVRTGKQHLPVTGLRTLVGRTNLVRGGYTNRDVLRTPSANLLCAGCCRAIDTMAWCSAVSLQSTCDPTRGIDMSDTEGFGCPHLLKCRRKNGRRGYAGM